MDLSYFLGDANNALAFVIGCFCFFFILSGFMCFKASLDFYLKHSLLKKGFHSSEIQRFLTENYPNTTTLKNYSIRYFLFGFLNLFLLSLVIVFVMKIN